MLKYRRIIVAGVMAASLLVMTGSALAATSIDENQQCTIKVETLGLSDPTFAEDINLVESIPVKFYKVADISVVGEYTALDEFADLGIGDKVDSDVDTDQRWSEIAKAAYALIKGVDVTDEEAVIPEEDVIAPSYTGTILQGNFEPIAVERGMYLVVVDRFDSQEYSYICSPYLISVPDNLYYHQDGAEDEWVYDVVVGLKPERKTRDGKLVINKDLTGFQKLLGPTTFVFEVEATKRNPITDQDEVVYSTATSLTFTGDGSQQKVLEGIPVGSNITVKEVYSGGSYEAVGDREVQVIMQGVIGEEVPEVQVFFNNKDNNELQPGHGVNNHFDSKENGGWEWVNPTVETDR